MADNTIPPPPAGYTEDEPPPPPGYSMQAPTPGGHPYDMTRGNDFSSKIPGDVIMGASLLPDPQAKIKFMSDKTGIPAMRFGVDHDGNIGYADETGWHLASPTIGGGSMANPLDLARRLGAQVGAHAGEALPIAGGAAGEIGGPVGAAGGAFAGDITRQALGNVIADRPLGDLSVTNAAEQGALGGAGSVAGRLVGAGGNAVFGNNPLRLSAADAAKVKGDLPAIQQAAHDADALGISTTPADLTGYRSARVTERQLGRTPEGGDILQELYGRRNTSEFPAALGSTMDQIAPQQSWVMGARDLQAGAKDVIDKIDTAGTTAASPYYEKAFNSGAQPDVSHLVNFLNGRLNSGELSSTTRGVIKDALDELTTQKTVIDPATGKSQVVTVPVNNYRALHGAKLEIDSTLDRLANKGTPPNIIKAASYELTPIQQNLTLALRNASPDYEKGYQAYIAGRKDLDAAKKSLVGMLADPSRTAENLPAMLRHANASDVGTARQLFDANGQMSAWESGVRAMIDEAGNTAQKTLASGQVGNVPGKFQAAVAGTPEQQKMLPEAIGQTVPVNTLGATAPNPALSRFDQLIGTSKRIAGTLPEGSPTATDMGQGNRFASPTAVAVSKIIHGINPFDIPAMVGESVLRRSVNRNASKLAQAYARPSPLDQLGDLANTYVPIGPTGAKVLGVGGQTAGRLASAILGLPNAPYQPPSAP